MRQYGFLLTRILPYQDRICYITNKITRSLNIIFVDKNIIFVRQNNNIVYFQLTKIIFRLLVILVVIKLYTHTDILESTILSSYGRIRVSENSYSRIFYPVELFYFFKFCMDFHCGNVDNLCLSNSGAFLVRY